MGCTRACHCSQCIHSDVSSLHRRHYNAAAFKLLGESVAFTSRRGLLGRISPAFALKVHDLQNVWDFEEEVALMVMEMLPLRCEHPKHFYSSSIQKRKIDDLLLRSSRARQHNKPRIATWRGMASCGGIIVFKNMFFISSIWINIFDFFLNWIHSKVLEDFLPPYLKTVILLFSTLK